MMINLGDDAISLALNVGIDLTSYMGRWVVIYFYPKDATAGCTKEAQDFRDQLVDFTALNAVILGVSRDSLKSHENFKKREQLPFELLSDSESKLCELFDVLKMKSMYGRQYLGIERSTFLLDPQGIIKGIWRKVKVNGHVNEVLCKLQDILNN